MVREVKGYLGLELAGAKNEKTTLAALEYYPRERKIFLLDIYEKISGGEQQTSDEALLEMIDELKPGVAAMGVNVPLTLPPCITCDRASCDTSRKCTQPSVRYMSELVRKAARRGRGKSKARAFTPYTQRPVELYVRYRVMPDLEGVPAFEIDEALGGNKAPLTARMSFLKRRMDDLPLKEVWPKLAVAVLGKQLGLPKRQLERYRNLEEGAHARMEILETLSANRDVFIYDRDLRKLAQSLAAFDAFVCAYVALLSDAGHCARPPAGFPVASGWVEYPQLD